MLHSARRLVVFLVVATLATPATTFVAVTHPRHLTLRSSPLILTEPSKVAEDCGCADVTADATGVGVPTATKGSIVMNDVRITGSSLRSTELVDARGRPATVGSVIGEDGRAVVVFLRHLG